MTSEELKEKAKEIRLSVLDMVYRAKSQHVGTSFSAADILAALYFEVMNIDSKNPKKEGRDRLILSKGHGVTGLYSTLAIRGYFPKEKLEEYGQDGTTLASHVVLDAVPGAETSNGSGGHGQSIGNGMAMADLRKKNGARVFVLCGDGEMNEGSVWEAILFAGFHKLNNLTLIIDRNGLQIGGTTKDVLDINPLDEKLKAFRWDVTVVDGHDFDELVPALKKKADKPHAIIANTVKGKGVSYMENKVEWHGSYPDEEQYKQALEELS